MRLPLPRSVRRFTDSGQAAITLVLAIVLLLVTSGGILAANSEQHDPLVQADVVQHYAYRALEAGMNSYLRTINETPDLVTCDTTSESSTCKAEIYDKWFQVPTTKRSTDSVPEYYLWTNPQLCFSTTKTLSTVCTTSPSTGNLEYVQILVVGAAGTPGNFQYQQSVANFAPENSFLTHLWWSDYEAEPTSKTAARTACKWDWTNGYAGPGTACTKPGYSPGVYFGPGTVIDGPVFSNDSIYVTGDPTFGTKAGTHPTALDTADPGCLVVTVPGTKYSSPKTTCTSDPTSRAAYTKTNSHHALAKEYPPSTDSSLDTLAKSDGCTYSGPTTISFIATHAGKTGYMNVYSPETPTKATPTNPAITHDSDNTSKNHNICVGTDIRVPDGTPSGAASDGNGVIYVQTATGSCSSEKDNPYDAYLTKDVTVTVIETETVTVTVTVTETVTVTVTVTVPYTTHGHTKHHKVKEKEKVKEKVKEKEKEREPVTVKKKELQTVVTTTRAQTSSQTDTPTTMNCAGDAFVHDANKAPGGKESGFAGNLTVATANNVVITGPLRYSDCQSGFTSEEACTYNDGTGAVNDSLGLIANNYVVANRPVCPNGKNSGNDTYCTSNGLLKRCTAEDTASTWTTWENALCNPASTSTTPTGKSSEDLAIDSAIIALNHSFTVDNFTTGKMTGTLIVYGAMVQYWRGEVGIIGSDGFVKYYTWDSRLQYVSIPAYLSPNLPSWGLVSSTVDLENGCPAWPRRFPTGFAYVKTKKVSTTTVLRTHGTSISTAPTGALCT